MGEADPAKPLQHTIFSDCKFPAPPRRSDSYGMIDGSIGCVGPATDEVFFPTGFAKGPKNSIERNGCLSRRNGLRTAPMKGKPDPEETEYRQRHEASDSEGHRYLDEGQPPLTGSN